MGGPTPEQVEHLATEAALRAGRLEQLPASLTALAGYPNVRDAYTFTPLIILAISWAPIATVSKLLDAGADVNVEVDDGFPAVLNAVMSHRDDRLELVEMLATRGGELNARGVNGWTPLHAAAAANDVELVRLLLLHGADPASRTGVDDDSTPLDEAQRAGAIDAARLLSEA